MDAVKISRRNGYWHIWNYFKNVTSEIHLFKISSSNTTARLMLIRAFREAGQLDSSYTVILIY